jgi:hypothetical protein
VLYLAGLLVVFLPWPIRNYLVTSELILFTTEGGKILFQGTYLPGDDLRMNLLRQLPAFAALETAQPADAIEQYHYWQQMALEQIRADPVAQARMCVRKVVRFWMYLPAHSWVPAWKTGLAAAVFLPLALIGVLRGWRRPLVQLCALWVGGLWLFHGIVHAETRYNFPVMPMMFLLAALGVLELAALWGRSTSPGITRSV